MTSLQDAVRLTNEVLLKYRKAIQLDVQFGKEGVEGINLHVTLFLQLEGDYDMAFDSTWDQEVESLPNMDMYLRLMLDALSCAKWGYNHPHNPESDAWDEISLAIRNHEKGRKNENDV